MYVPIFRIFTVFKNGVIFFESIFLFTVTYCEDLNILHGRINQSEPVNVGQSIHVACDEGYQLSDEGATILRCSGGGKYDHDIPACNGIQFSVSFMPLIAIIKLCFHVNRIFSKNYHFPCHFASV